VCQNVHWAVVRSTDEPVIGTQEELDAVEVETLLHDRASV
jgi:hypothetical protein